MRKVSKSHDLAYITYNVSFRFPGAVVRHIASYFCNTLGMFRTILRKLIAYDW